MRWWERADCLGETRIDPTLPDLPLALRRRIARWYCIECQVRPDCAEDALARGDVGHIRGGVWTGGRRGEQSRHVKAQLRRAAAGASQ